MADLRFRWNILCTVILVRMSFLLSCFQVTPCQTQVLDGTIRTEDARSGLVEVFLERRWGTISNDNLDENAPTVICRQLGFRGPAEKRNDTKYDGSNENPVWIISSCPQSAVSILECERSMQESINIEYSQYDHKETFDHNNDLGVICHDPPNPRNLSFVVIDIILFVVTLIFIVIFAYLAYLFVQKKSKAREFRRYPSYNPNYHSPEEMRLQEVKGEDNLAYVSVQ